MKTFYDAIYLSPHLDDAVLSCGGQIFQRTSAGKSVLVVTVMAGDSGMTAVSSFAQSLHDRWQLAVDAVARRREEDIAACRLLGADFLHWEVPDCIYRVHPQTGEPFYNSNAGIFGDIHPAEFELVDSLAGQMASLPEREVVFAPLTVGHHVDHQITRLAAERHFHRRLHYFEDYPYAAIPQAWEGVFAFDAAAWQQKVIPLSETAIQAKIEAIASYASQVSTFFNGRSDLEQQIRAYAGSVGGERIWWRDDVA